MLSSCETTALSAYGSTSTLYYNKKSIMSQVYNVVLFFFLVLVLDILRF